MKLGRRATADRGQTLVEFALILPILILLLVGVFDLGRAVHSYNTISNAAREGMRLAIVDQNQAAIEDRAVKHAVSVGIDADDVTIRYLSPSLAESGPCFKEEPITGTAGVGCVAEVKLTYQFNAATPLIGNLVGPIQMEAQSRQPVERSYSSP